MIFLFALSVWLVCYLAHRLITPIVVHIVETTSTTLDDYFLNRPVLHASWNLVASLIFSFGLPILDQNIGISETVMLYAGRAGNALIALSIMLLLVAFLGNLAHFTSQENQQKSHHVVSILQFLKILAILLGTIAVVALVMGRNPMGLIAGLGAAATVLMLVFRDTILGLVAGIQLSVFKMLKPGDWVSLPQHGIDGIVIMVSLATVKVRNFDNSISTIPPYTLVSESFRNWDNMKQCGARRVKRALLIDVATIRRLSVGERTELAGRYLSDVAVGEGEEQPVNLTLYRRYVTDYLSRHGDVLRPDEAWVLVRQLEPTPQGLPLELWFYLRQTEFVSYETLVADIIEELIATLPDFRLRLFQVPAGSDLQSLKYK